MREFVGVADALAYLRDTLGDGASISMSLSGGRWKVYASKKDDWGVTGECETDYLLDALNKVCRDIDHKHREALAYRILAAELETSDDPLALTETIIEAIGKAKATV